MASCMIITCASSKGGVGKSTTVACLAGAFAHTGETVHIVDLDSNRTVSRWFREEALRARGISLSTPDPQDLTTHLQSIEITANPDIVLIDVAGSYERALTVATARAHLTIIPATLTEADIFEAAKTANHIHQIFASFGREPLLRLLLTKVQPLSSHAQKHAAKEVKRFRLPLFDNALGLRAAYEEVGLSGLPPHFADPERPTVAKALAELNALRDEIYALTGAEHAEPVTTQAAGAA
jgi:chromosome partitioning protein